MKIALINENSQASKNSIIYEALEKVAKKYGHEVLNFGMYGKENEDSLTYVQAGLMAAILLNSKGYEAISLTRMASRNNYQQYKSKCFNRKH